MNVEHVAVGWEHSVIPVGRAAEKHDGATGRHRLTIELDVAGDVAGSVDRRRLEAQYLLDGVRYEGTVLDQLTALIGMITEYLSGPADQSVGGLVAAPGENIDERQDLVAGQAPNRTGLVLELDIEQLGHQIIRGVIHACQSMYWPKN